LTVFPDVYIDTTRTFEFDARGPAGGINDWENRLDPSEWIFAPGETKKKVFDFTTGNDLIAHKFPPGNYLVRGGFADYWSAYSSFVIGPRPSASRNRASLVARPRQYLSRIQPTDP
jgi:hypothetical protein